jgi:hypothetical protein
MARAQRGSAGALCGCDSGALVKVVSQSYAWSSNISLHVGEAELAGAMLL